MPTDMTPVYEVLANTETAIELEPTSVLSQLNREALRALVSGPGHATVAVPRRFVDAYLPKVPLRSIAFSWLPSRTGGPATMAMHTPEQRFCTWVMASLLGQHTSLRQLVDSHQLNVACVLTVDQLRLDFTWDLNRVDMRQVISTTP